MAKPHRIAGAASENLIKAFFASNALVAIVVLALITIFLFREGAGFFDQNLKNIRLYRRAGLEFVDIMRAQSQGYSALSRRLNDIRVQAQATASAGALEQFDVFAGQFSDAAEELNGLVSDTGDQAVAFRASLLGQKATDEVENIPDTAAATAGLAGLRAAGDKFDAVSASLREKVHGLLNNLPIGLNPAVEHSLQSWRADVRQFLDRLPDASAQLREWDPHKPVPAYRALTAFLFGTEWITASFWQDWYGIIPLLVGSIMVAVVALVIAVPFGVAAAIYVGEVAARGEKSFIKPYLEFIAAIPSVVLGFFGIAVVGQAVRALSQTAVLSWVPFFPISERLNVFTAGCLLALMAVPTIFTLSEDALRNVPRGFKEASYALGANRLQTLGRVLVPASLSGMVSAALLGLGRVVGETMVVLLCAGNRIAIPDFTEGLGAFFQPVHTMTGIIAQEMGEVVRGSIHYRALFMVGLVLFLITLVINYLAQKLVARYRMTIG
ncbi:MAG TPA: phosphate ABC transporter permease subunit PstC [Chthoniobacterales bacterium]|nr:phosphate ABC transporter permease subunit PstC [Chthoniobacterales bacterium]